LENEFVYPQLGPHYLQSFLEENDIETDLLILYEKRDDGFASYDRKDLDLNELNMLLLKHGGTSLDTKFDHAVFKDYDIVGFSVMTPQAPDAYTLNQLIRKTYPHITTVIGGSHPRYYQNQVVNLPSDKWFDFVVPQDGWVPMLEIATGKVVRKSTPVVLTSSLPKLTSLPPPTRPYALMEKYNFEIGGVPAFHTITALGCPFTCHFCESGIEKVRTFSERMIEEDLEKIAATQKSLGQDKKAVMFFDDVGLMSPKQVKRLSDVVNKYEFDSWRAFTHAYLLVRHKELLLQPFKDSGGKRVGIGLETGSQRSLDLINKRNGKKQSVAEHYEAVSIANSMGVAVDAFTMIYPWEDENDIEDTNKLVEFIVSNKVDGVDEKQRPMYNHVDSTIMSPFQGTKFFDMISIGALPNVKIDPAADPGNLYYKGADGGSGWPYIQTRLPRAEYEITQAYRNSLRPSYR